MTLTFDHVTLIFDPVTHPCIHPPSLMEIGLLFGPLTPVTLTLTLTFAKVNEIFEICDHQRKEHPKNSTTHQVWWRSDHYLTFDPSDLDLDLNLSKNDLDLLPRDPSLHPPTKFEGDQTIIWTFDPSDLDLDLDLCKGKRDIWNLWSPTERVSKK